MTLSLCLLHLVVKWQVFVHGEPIIQQSLRKKSIFP